MDRPLTSARVLDIIKHQPTLPFFVTYRFLLHLEQPRKPKLCEKLQQEIPEVLRQELADLHGDGHGEGNGDGDGDCDDNSLVLRENWLTFTSDGDGDSERDVDVDDGDDNSEVLRENWLTFIVMVMVIVKEMLMLMMVRF